MRRPMTPRSTTSAGASMAVASGRCSRQPVSTAVLRLAFVLAAMAVFAGCPRPGPLTAAASDVSVEDLETARHPTVEEQVAAHGYYEVMPGAKIVLPKPEDGPVASTLIIHRGDGRVLDGTGTLVLFNRTASALAVLPPGDGSENSMRTPSLTWIVNGVPVYPQRECGNISGLRSDELRTLTAGGTATFQFPLPPFKLSAGAHMVQVLYELAPGMMWSGIHPAHNQAALARLSVALPFETITPPVLISGHPEQAD